MSYHLSQSHTSQLLRNLLAQHSKETIRLGDLIRSLGSRAFIPTVLICALPEALPIAALIILGIMAGAIVALFS